MEPLSPHRFQSGGGYQCHSPTVNYGSNKCTQHVTGSSQNNNRHEDEQGHSPLAPASPSRLRQQQLAQRMMKRSCYEEGLKHGKPGSGNSHHEDYDYHIRSTREHYNLGHNDATNADLVPPWETTTSKEDYVRRCAERAICRRNGGAPNFDDTDDNYDSDHMKENEPALSGLPDAPQSPPRSTKSVSFNTRDKIHQWDDQLDQLKYVDEAFFAAAKYLLEDIHNVTNDYYLEKEEDNFKRFHHLQSDVEHDEVIRNKSVGIMAKLFQCGNLRDIGETSHQRPYLGLDGEVLDNGKCANQLKDNMFKLTEKLIQDFETAVKFRMQNLEENYLTPTEKTGEKAAKTKEIARKIDAYGLPKLWKNDTQAKEEFNATMVTLNEDSVVSKRSLVLCT